MEREDFSEIYKLDKLLKVFNIPHELTKTRNLSFKRVQIWYPSQQNPRSDAIVIYKAVDGKPWSFGAPLLEIMGLTNNDDEVQGSLTAEEVLKIWISDWNELS